MTLFRYRKHRFSKPCICDIFRSLMLIAILVSIGGGVAAQKVAVKTNVISDAATNINLAAEIALNQNWTAELAVDQNYWTLSHGKRWKHLIFQPELRYWLCDRFSGHFLGLHIQGGQYNIGHIDNSLKLLGTDFSKLSDYRFQGWFVGAGIGYGYDLILGKHWNLEGEIGIGYNYTRSDKYRCVNCGKKVKSNINHNYFGPTKLALNLIYLF